VGAPPAAPARDQPAHCSLGAHHEGAGARGAQPAERTCPGRPGERERPAGHTMLRWRRANAAASERARSSDWAAAEPPCRPTLTAQARLQHSPAPQARASGACAPRRPQQHPRRKARPGHARSRGARGRGGLTPIHAAMPAAPDQLVQLDAVARGCSQCAVVRHRHAARPPAGLHARSPGRWTSAAAACGQCARRGSAAGAHLCRSGSRKQAPAAQLDGVGTACGCSGGRQASRPAPSAAGARPGPAPDCAQLLHGRKGTCSAVPGAARLLACPARLRGASLGSATARTAQVPLSHSQGAGAGRSVLHWKQGVVVQVLCCAPLLAPQARLAQERVTRGIFYRAPSGGPRLKAPVCAYVPTWLDGAGVSHNRRSTVSNKPNCVRSQALTRCHFAQGRTRSEWLRSTLLSPRAAPSAYLLERQQYLCAGTSTACWLWTRAQLFTTCGELHKEHEVLCSLNSDRALSVHM